jgi:fluoroquinolone resistance protein
VEGCSFAFSDLRNVRFLQCDLSFAAFDRSDLFSVEMDRCNLLGSRFTKVDFSHAYSRKVVTTRAVFRGCNLGLAEMAELRLASCDLSGCRFREANLERTDLSGADLRDCDLFQAVLDGAKLDRADLTGAEISGLNLLRLASFARLKINADQQHVLLAALGIDVDI